MVRVAQAGAMGLLGLLVFASTVNCQKVLKGPYAVAHKTYESDRFDRSGRHIEVWSPSSSTKAIKFKLISYVHGFIGGGPIESTAYFELLRSFAAFGYVIVAPRACDVGCVNRPKSLPHDPPGFGTFYEQQLLGIDWAKNQTAAGDPMFVNINYTGGVGVAGHSMGGQATLFSSSYANATRHNIKAAVMHHPYTHSFPPPSVPFIVFTGALDHTAPAAPMAVPIYESTRAVPRAIVNKRNATHHEPDILGYNKLLPQFSAAWMKIYLDGTPNAYGIDFDELIFGTGDGSVCHGGDGKVVDSMCHTDGNPGVLETRHRSSVSPHL